MPKLQSLVETTQNWASQRDLDCHFLPETGSTNDNAKAAALKEGVAPALYLTGHQTHGRGRGKNQWLDTGSGESLLATWSFHVDAPPQAITAPRVGLAVYSAANSVWPSLNWSLKAPNDLLVNGKKTCGLLIETVSDGHSHRLLVGMGFNIFNHPRAFADATHLGVALPQALDEAEWFQFLDRLHEELTQSLADVQKAELSPDICRKLAAALKANPNAKIDVEAVSPRGDLIYKGGIVPWTEL